jgi:hypothetical protein
MVDDLMAALLQTAVSAARTIQIGAVPNWIATLVGVLVGFGVTISRDAWRNRRRLQMSTVGGLVLYARPNQGRWFAETANENTAQLVIRLDLRLVNHSYLDDAVTEALLRMDGQRGEIALTTGYVYFYGENVPAHSLRHVRLIFTFPKSQYGRHNQWRFTAQGSPLHLLVSGVRLRNARQLDFHPIPEMLAEFGVGEEVTEWVRGEK